MPTLAWACGSFHPGASHMATQAWTMAPRQAPQSVAPYHPTLMVPFTPPADCSDFNSYAVWLEFSDFSDDTIYSRVIVPGARALWPDEKKRAFFCKRLYSNHLREEGGFRLAVVSAKFFDNKHLTHCWPASTERRPRSLPLLKSRDLRGWPTV